MQEELDLYREAAEESMQEAVDRLGRELSRVRTGKASPSVFNGVMADYYGTLTEISQMANITTPDARSIIIQPWDKSALQPIESAIIKANMGFNPQNDGEIIRISVPPLTEERRRDMVKKLKVLAEEAKVSVRNARRDLMDEIKKAVKEGYPEDMGKDFEKETQNLTNSFTTRIDRAADDREKEVMTV
jgi:ribosome recycling factor